MAVPLIDAFGYRTKDKMNWARRQVTRQRDGGRSRCDTRRIATRRLMLGCSQKR